MMLSSYSKLVKLLQSISLYFFLISFLATGFWHLVQLRRRPDAQPVSGVLVHAGQPEGHVLTRRGHHHVLGVELHALHGAGVVAVEHADLGAVLSVPDVDAPVCWTGNNKLTVRRERGFQRDLLGVYVALELRKVAWISILKFREVSVIKVLIGKLTVKVWRQEPEKASISLIMLPLVETKIVLPSGLNLRPVHSTSLSTAKLNKNTGLK